MRAKKRSRILTASLVGMLLFIGAATILFLPLHYKWYVLHRFLMIPSRLIIGAVYVPMFMGGTLFQVRYLEVIYVVIAAVSGFLLGGLVYFLWSKHWLTKILVILLVLLQLSFGGLFVSFSGDIVEGPEEVCRAAVTADISLKVLYYDGGWGGNYFVLSTVDGGDSWQQAMVQYYDTWDEWPPPPDCDEQVLKVKTLPNNPLVWMWANRNFSVSHDGGRHWETWRSACRIRERCDYGPISSVTFEDSQRGHMEVVPFRDGTTTDIYSSDGGLTWE